MAAEYARQDNSPIHVGAPGMTATVPRVSVLMTAYNRERFVGEAIASVLAQTYADFELVIVDDRSNDGTVDIAHQFARRDTRIRVVVNEQNLGDYPNRNRAASLASGELLKYHDSDDVMYPHCLEVLVSALDRFPEAGFALTRGNHWPGGAAPMLSTPRLSYQREYLGSGIFGCGPSGALCRRSAFEALGGFEETGPASDYLFWMRACLQMPVVLAPGDLFYYRIHPNQELLSPGASHAHARAAARAWEILSSPDCPLRDEERNIARRNHAARVARQALWDVRDGAPGLASYRITHAGLSLIDWLVYLRRPRRTAFAGTPPVAEAASSGH